MPQLNKTYTIRSDYPHTQIANRRAKLQRIYKTKLGVELAEMMTLGYFLREMFVVGVEDLREDVGKDAGKDVGKGENKNG